jgi:hypothetical protein
VGQWGTASVKGFSGWKTDCGCDGTNSINKDPLFLSVTVGSEDLHLQSTSPAVRIGELGADLGAYPLNSTSVPPPLAAPTQVSVK